MHVIYRIAPKVNIQTPTKRRTELGVKKCMVNASGREETTFEERKGRGVSTIKHL
jgi:hypothetical protein